METERIYASSTSFKKEDKRDQVRCALKHVWSYLEKYLPLANTHGAEFITDRHWDTYVPEGAQQTLLALTRDELINLPERCASSVRPSDDRYKITEATRNDWLSSFIDDAYRCRLENVIKLSSVVDVASLRDGHSQAVITSSQERGVISEAMSEKKNYEVGVMSEAVLTLFKHSKADIIVDVGSGKGYLDCELARHHKLPVVGLDSCNSNTQGAIQRDGKLAKKWKGLTRRMEVKEKKHLQGLDRNKLSSCDPSQNVNHENNRTDNIDACKLEARPCFDGALELQQELRNLCKNSASSEGIISEITTSGVCALVVSNNSASEKVSHQKQETISHEEINSHCRLKTANHHQVETVNHQKQEAVVNHKEINSHSSLKTTRDHETETVIHQKQETVNSEEANIYYKPDAANHQMTQIKNIHELEQPGSVEETAPSGLSFYVPVTLSVQPDMNLQQVVKDHASHLCLSGSASQNIFLTGLHTCGSLSVTVMRLFLQDPAVVGLCFVGCCYQLMNECFSEEDFSSEISCCHLPLSDFGKQMKICLGRNARNLASQSVNRTQASEQLQGADFFWRALVEVLLHEVGVTVPERLPVRGLQKKSKSFNDYVLTVLKKLQLSPDLVTPELVASIEEKYKNVRKEMAAFFQLKVVLAPVIESLIILDRCLYLLEQELVEDVHIVHLFDPMVSPRCYAITALKANKEAAV